MVGVNRWLALSVASLVGSAGVACDAGGGGSVLGDGGSDGDGAGGAGGAISSVGGFDAVGGSSQGGGPEITEVYGHSANTLYRLDPVTKEVTTIGTFSGCSGVIDIAVDKDNLIYGTTSDGLWRIDNDSAACSYISSGSYPNSLSFVPEGTLDPTEEALVGYAGSTYVRIDTGNGSIQNVGAITGGLSSSGDIVSVKDGGTFLTVTGNSCGDCLVEVDPATGDLIDNYGSVGHSGVFGLAFWGGSAYGFSNGGELFEIGFSGTVVTTTPITIPGAPGSLSFWGAGSSTHVPVDIPQ